MSENNNLLIGLGLIVGAVYFSRRATAAKIAAAPRGPLGTGSMPGSVGTGVAQQLGGLLGNLLAPKTGGGTQTGAPPPNATYDQFQPMAGDGVINNSTDLADPMSTFDPQMGDSNPWAAFA